MRHTFGSLALVMAMSSAAPVMAQDTQKKPGPFDPIEIGEGVTLDPIVDMRFRVETAEQSTFPDTATSITVRTRAGAELKWAKNFSVLVEGEGTFALEGDYNDTIPSNGIEPFPVIADPESFSLNRAQIAYKNSDFAATLGRQRIILDDARFVGNVGWRQNEQTFDAARVKANLGSATIDQTYALKQHTIFGSQSPISDFEGDFIFTNVKVPFGNKFSVTAFRYEIDYDTRVLFSSITYGATAQGKIPVGAVTIGLKGTYAGESDTGANPNDFSADYYLAEGSLTWKGFTLRGQYEVLGSDGGLVAFQTPLATAHKFNGYADLFLVTPATGLQDTNVRLSKKVKVPGLAAGINVQFTYHDFQSDFGQIDYGDEFDWVVSTKIKGVALLAKYGDYNSNGFGPDTTRFTIQAGVSF